MQYSFHIGGVPVYGRSLPSGDLAVWHPFHPAAREIIEPICRGRGYWRPDHNNWIVFRPFREVVLAELERVGERHV